MKRKIKHWLTSEGPTSAKYQQRADRITNVMGWIGIVMAIIGAITIWFIISSPYTCVGQALK